MPRYEYKVVPAPARGRKAPGVKGPEARFAHGLETAINSAAAEGWEYLRADILPSEERQGLTSTQTVYRSVLVFRRELDDFDAHPHPAPPLQAGSLAEEDAGAELENAESSEAYEDTSISDEGRDRFEDPAPSPNQTRT